MNLCDHYFVQGLAMGYVIICSTMIAYLFWFNGIQKLGAGRASIFFNFVPVFT
ncbi:EamA family transporter [Acinetobacter baumannii]